MLTVLVTLLLVLVAGWLDSRLDWDAENLNQEEPS